MLKSTELRKLPAGTLSVIVDILEINNDWKKVMSIIPANPSEGQMQPKYNIEHIRLIEEHARATKQKCTEILLDEWGTSGRVRPTLATLKNIVIAAGVYRAGDEIARILKEQPPARPVGGPEQQITTNVTDLLNQTFQQQISTAQAKDSTSKNVYQNQTTEPIHYEEGSLNTEDLPYFSDLHSDIGNKATTQMKQKNDFMDFPTTSEFNNKIYMDIDVDTDQNLHPDPTNEQNLQPLIATKGAILGVSVKPTSNSDLDSIIFQDPNLTHFQYDYLEIITNYFSDKPPTQANPISPGKIGSGGYGDVFVGIHPQLGALAIKRANQRQSKPELASKVFNSEVKCLLKFRHKNIVPILGYSVDGPAQCIICEYIAGGSLLDKIAEKVLSEYDRINIMLGAAEGLKYLHTYNKDLQSKQSAQTESNSQNSANIFMHGDVKSANILLTKNNVPKLCDFGLAKQYETTFQMSQLAGTSAYMAPEGWRGTITQKRDVYSYGIVLLELLTGLKPIVNHQNGEKIHIKLYISETCGNNDISPLLDRSAQWSKANNLFKLAQICLEDDRHKRPTMSLVCDALNVIKNI